MSNAKEPEYANVKCGEIAERWAKREERMRAGAPFELTGSETRTLLGDVAFLASCVKHLLEHS